MSCSCGESSTDRAALRRGGGTVGRGGGGGHLGAPELDAPVDGGGQVEVREVQRAGRGVARHGGDGARVRLHALRHAGALPVPAAWGQSGNVCITDVDTFTRGTRCQNLWYGAQDVGTYNRGTRCRYFNNGTRCPLVY